MNENDRQPSDHDETQPIRGVDQPAAGTGQPGAGAGAGAGQAAGTTPGAAQPGPAQPPGAAAQAAGPGPTPPGPGAPGSGPGAPPLGAGAGQSTAGPSPYEQHHHRYGAGPEHTSAYDTRVWGAPAGGPFFGSAQPDPVRTRSKGRGGLVAAVLAGALVLGGLAGFGGAATYDLFDGPDSASSATSNETATSVVEREDKQAPEGSVEDVANSVLPSVVKVNVRGMGGEGSGSGVIISEDGEILTNYHVVEAAAQGGSVSVGFNDGSTAQAEVIGVDPLTDLAIIKAQDVSGLKPAALGQSSNLDVGEEVVAIGSPFGLDATVTSGIVSALHRPVSISSDSPSPTESPISTTYPAIQTDAAINPGNSGGPLVNMNGEVVGINSSIRTSSSSMGQGGSIGLGFAIPLDEVLPIVDQLRNGETPTHAQLGVSVSDATSDDGLLNGAGVAQVTGGSAGDKAGIERGDVIVKVDGRPVTDASSLVATIRGHRPGDPVTLTVVRNDETLEIEATLDSDEGDPLS